MPHPTHIATPGMNSLDHWLTTHLWPCVDNRPLFGALGSRSGAGNVQDLIVDLRRRRPLDGLKRIANLPQGASGPFQPYKSAVDRISFIEILFNTKLLYRKHIGHSKQHISMGSSGIAKLAVLNRIVIETALFTEIPSPKKKHRTCTGGLNDHLPLNWKPSCRFVDPLLGGQVGGPTCVCCNCLTGLGSVNQMKVAKVEFVSSPKGGPPLLSTVAQFNPRLTLHSLDPRPWPQAVSKNHWTIFQMLYEESRYYSHTVDERNPLRTT